MKYILYKEVDQYHPAKYLINYCLHTRDEQGCFRGKLATTIFLCILRKNLFENQNIFL